MYKAVSADVILIVYVPAAIAVTFPFASTLTPFPSPCTTAYERVPLLLDDAPIFFDSPTVSEKLPPVDTEASFLYTETVIVADAPLLLPVSPAVIVIVVLPAPFAVTFPLPSTVATPVLEDE